MYDFLSSLLLYVSTIIIFVLVTILFVNFFIVPLAQRLKPVYVLIKLINFISNMISKLKK